MAPDIPLRDQRPAQNVHAHQVAIRLEEIRGRKAGVSGGAP
jgi:hypothetical protein